MASYWTGHLGVARLAERALDTGRVKVGDIFPQTMEFLLQLPFDREETSLVVVG